MATVIAAVVAGLLGLLIGGIVAYFYVRGQMEARNAKSGADAERVVAQAQAQQKEIILEAKDEAHKIRASAEGDARERRADVQRMERRIQQKEENLDRRLEGLEKRERQFCFQLGFRQSGCLEKVIWQRERHNGNLI